MRRVEDLASFLLVGLGCSAIFFFFMYGTLQKVFRPTRYCLVFSH